MFSAMQAWTFLCLPCYTYNFYLIGLPIRNDMNHGGEIASMSLHLLRAIKSFKIKHRPEEKVQLRIGMHAGK